MKFLLGADSYTLHKILPNKIDPLVSLMMVEKVPDSTYDVVGGLSKQIKEIKEVICWLKKIQIRRFVFAFFNAFWSVVNYMYFFKFLECISATLAFFEIRVDASLQLHLWRVACLPRQCGLCGLFWYAAASRGHF